MEILIGIFSAIWILIIPALFIFWIIAVIKKPPKFKNLWFISNSNRRVFNYSNDQISFSKIKKALNAEFEKKKKYYKKNFFS